MFMLSCNGFKVVVNDIAINGTSLVTSLVNGGHDDLADLGFKHRDLMRYGLTIRTPLKISEHTDECNINDPDTYCNPVVAGLECNCGYDDQFKEPDEGIRNLGDGTRSISVGVGQQIGTVGAASDQ